VDNNTVLERLEISKYLEINKIANVVRFLGARKAGSRSTPHISFYVEQYLLSPVFKEW
jgi:hypothetical protein